MSLQRLSKNEQLIGSGVLGAQTLMNYKDVTITNAQALALRATPVTLVAAPGAGKLLVFHHAILVVNAAAGVYGETAANLAVRQTNTTGALVSDAIETTGWIDQVAIKATTARAKLDALSVLLNAALVLHNTGAGEWTGGNAANTLKVRCFYTIQRLGFGTLA